MNNFFDYLNEDIGRVFQALVEAIGSCFNFLNYLFNFPMRMEIIKSYENEFSTKDWIMLLLANLLPFVFDGVTAPLPPFPARAGSSHLWSMVFATTAPSGQRQKPVSPAVLSAQHSLGQSLQFT